MYPHRSHILKWPYINRAHPLWRDCVFAGVGPRVSDHRYYDCMRLDSAGNHASFYTDSAAVEWVTCENGVQCPKLVRATHHNTIQLPWNPDYADLSVSISYYPDDATNYGVFTTTNAGSYPYAIGYFSSRWRCTNIDGARRWYGPIASDPAVDEYVTIGGYRGEGTDNDSCGIYIDGEPIALTYSATDENSWIDNGLPGFGLGYLNTSWTDMRVVQCFVWQRRLTPAEFALLADKSDPLLDGAILP